jgi:hypothetical protein
VRPGAQERRHGLNSPTAGVSRFRRTDLLWVYRCLVRGTGRNLLAAFMVLASCGLLGLAVVDGVAWIWFGSEPWTRVWPLVVVVVLAAVALGFAGTRIVDTERHTSRR